jgi:hypothetical protein
MCVNLVGGKRNLYDFLVCMENTFKKYYCEGHEVIYYIFLENSNQIYFHFLIQRWWNNYNVSSKTIIIFYMFGLMKC